MTGTKIQAAERPIGDIFSDEYRFTIPRYQRPYAWTTEQAGEMLDDLFAASASKSAMDEADPYFLGSVVLVKEEGQPRSEVVDGQQRLTTLTVLLSVVREYVSPDFAASLEARLFQRGDPIKQTIDQPRLTLRERDQEFFGKHIQERAGVANIRSLASNALPDSQRNLVDNAIHFLNRFQTMSQADCERLVAFIDRHTYLVVVATRDFESAYRIFTVLNERGLDLTHTDILKSEIIGTISEVDQERYTRKWEAEEEDLGRQDFADLFSHIRMVYAKTKARESILKEVRASVLSHFDDGRTFIDDVLVPLSDAFEVVTRADYKAPHGADGVNESLRWLGLLDNDDWIPPAISYHRQHAANAADLQAFLTDLERLAASILIRRVDITRRVERYGRLLQAIDAKEDLFTGDSPLQLTDGEKVETLARLRGEIYTVTRIRLYVLLRLDSALSSGGASYDHPLITVEHVLPQSPAEPSTWRTWFTDDQREHWVHRLANLVLLTGRKNSEASNYEFSVKKVKYFTSKTGVSAFNLTTQVLSAAEWTPKLLETRQQDLIATLSQLWRLQ